MKCPKCGFNSFEYYDSCKKCSGDLTGYKQTYSVTSIVLPNEAKDRLAALSRSAESESNLVNDTGEAPDDLFSFDLSDDSPPPAKGNDNPFDFDEPALGSKPSRSSNSEIDVFADLLESTSQAEESPFGETTTATTPVVAKNGDVAAEHDEFDLGNFSWDDTPVEKTTTTDSAEGADDFDSLFGDTKEDTSK